MALTIGELREVLEADPEMRWQVNPKAAASEAIATRALGADPKGLPRAEEAPDLDLASLLDPGTNPFLAVRRAERNFVTPEDVSKAIPKETLRRLGLDEPAGGSADQPPEAGAAAAVDWRNRWGQNWITSVRNQNPCNACWAFAGVALVEAMVRIEDAMWTRLSEGDVHRGVGAPTTGTSETSRRSSRTTASATRGRTRGRRTTPRTTRLRTGTVARCGGRTSSGSAACKPRRTGSIPSGR